VLCLQLIVNITHLVAIIKVDKEDLPEKTSMLFDGIDYSIFAIAMVEWLLLLLSYLTRGELRFTCNVSIFTLVLGFVLKFTYLFIPYRELVDLADDIILKTHWEHLFQLIIFVKFVLPLYIPNLLLLRSCKQAASYLAKYYENVDEKFFYIFSAVFTAIYLLIVTIVYGMIFFIAQYYLEEYANYIPIAWTMWFVGSILEVYTIKPNRAIYNCIAVFLSIIWWVLVIIALSELNIISWVITTILGGWIQYLQLKLQLRDLFVMIDIYRKNNRSTEVELISNVNPVVQPAYESL
jgi:hypothetical protein